MKIQEKLQEVQTLLEEKKSSSSSEIDTKCTNAMQELTALLKENRCSDVGGLQRIYTELREPVSSQIGRVWNDAFLLMPGVSDPQVALQQEVSSQLGISLRERLDAWASEPTQAKNRVVVKERILSFLNNPTEKLLNLRDLNLHSLPDIFWGSSFDRLKILDISRNRFESLPESIGNLSALEILDCTLCENLTSLPENLGNLSALRRLNCSGCNNLTSLPESIGNLSALRALDCTLCKHLTSLPESIGNLSALRELNFSGCPIASLPESIGNLSALEILDCRNCPIASLPESIGNLSALRELNCYECNHLTSLPESLGNLFALEILDCRNCPIASLPESLGNLSALKVLNCSRCPITSLPESIGNLSALRELNCYECNHLTSLPESLGNLSALQKLYCPDCPIASLPETLLHLPTNCHISLTGSSLPDGLLSRLQIATSATEYSGPRIFLNMRENRQPTEEKTVAAMLDLLYKKANRTKPTFSKEFLDNSSLRTWLNRISGMADFKTKESNAALIHKILNYLELAQTDSPEGKEYKELFFPVIEEASITCGDRMALSILDLGIAHQLATIDPTNSKEVANLLVRGTWALSLLQQIAQQKIKTLRLVDPIEVVLAYPIKLRETLQLPIDVKEMLYFRCSSLSQEEIDSAGKFVLDHINNEEERYKFLIGQPLWIKSLKSVYPNEVADAENARAKSDNHLKAQKAYIDTLITLSKEAVLQWEIS